MYSNALMPSYIFALFGRESFSTARNNSVILRFACSDATLLRNITGEALDIFCGGELPRMRAQ